ncbi:MAG TPA: TonB family protein [Candidatus Sulfotelmatobacter sp.]
MRPKTTSAWFSLLLASCVSLPVVGQSQVSEKLAANNTTTSPAYRVGGDVTAPKVIYSPEPEFSEVARKAGYQGTCAVSLIVGTDGRPRQIRVIRKLGMQLDEKAIQALREWKFEPAQKDGKPVAVSIEVEFSFHLGRNGASQQMFSAEQYEQIREARSRIQSQIFRISDGEEPLVCSASSSDGHRPAATIAELILEGDLHMPNVDRSRIAILIKEQSYFGNEDQIASEVSEKVQRAWQNAGYFAAQAHAEARVLTSSPSSEQIAITVQIEEGQQYRLEGIRFRNNKALTNVNVLRDLFPIQDGDLVNRDLIEKGMRDLHRVYGEYGYINLASVPTTRIHQEQATVSFDIDLDEGKQFYISRVNVVGLDEKAFQNVKREMILKPGDIYNQRLMELFQERYTSQSSNASLEPRYQLHMDQSAGTVAMTYDFRLCQTD